MELLLGFLIAALIAMTGVGAGTITAPLLILFLHVPVAEAVGTALVYSAAVKLVVVPVQIWRRQVVWRTLGIILARRNPRRRPRLALLSARAPTTQPTISGSISLSAS